MDQSRRHAGEQTGNEQDHKTDRHFGCSGLPKPQSSNFSDQLRLHSLEVTGTDSESDRDASQASEALYSWPAPIFIPPMSPIAFLDA